MHYNYSRDKRWHVYGVNKRAVETRIEWLGVLWEKLSIIADYTIPRDYHGYSTYFLFGIYILPFVSFSLRYGNTVQ